MIYWIKCTKLRTEQVTILDTNVTREIAGKKALKTLLHYEQIHGSMNLGYL